MTRTIAESTVMTTTVVRCRNPKELEDRAREAAIKGAAWDKRLLLIAGAAMGVASCAGTPIVTAIPNSCASLLPEEWRQGVAGAPLPDGDTVGDWVAFADQQTGKLDIANDRTKSAIGIVERCEARDAAAVKRATRRKFLGIF